MTDSWYDPENAQYLVWLRKQYSAAVANGFHATAKHLRNRIESTQKEINHG